jgi:hypothetical protein
MNDDRYLMQPTDMSSDTFHSCLVNHELVEVPRWDSDMSILIWRDDQHDVVAVQIHDQHDEHGRCQRVRRQIAVPDGPVQDCDTCVWESVSRAEGYCVRCVRSGRQDTVNLWEQAA